MTPYTLGNWLGELKIRIGRLAHIKRPVMATRTKSIAYNFQKSSN